MNENELEQLKLKFEKSNLQPEKGAFHAEHPIGIYWVKNINRTLSNVIHENSSAEDKIHKIQDTNFYSGDSDDEKIKELTFQCWEKWFKKRNIVIETLDEKYQESEYYNHKKIFSKYGKMFSLDMMTKLNIVFDIEKYCPTLSKKERINVLEIGGGFGTQARLIKLKFENCRYILTDLPETLFFAYIYLRLNFPSAKIAFVSTKDEAETVLKQTDYDFILVPCFFSGCMNRELRIDLALNTRSLGEMNNKSSKYYLDLLENKVNTDYVLLLNRFLNCLDTINDGFRLKENGCFVQMGPNWKVLHCEFQPEFTCFPYNEQFIHCSEMYFIGQKTAKPENYDLAQEEYLKYWYKRFLVQPDYFRSLEVNIDKGKDGALIRLFNAIRVNKNEKHIDAMIKLLYGLEKKYMFEERPYYMDLYKEITGREHPIKWMQKRYFMAKVFNKIYLLPIIKRLWILSGFSKKTN